MSSNRTRHFHAKGSENLCSHHKHDIAPLSAREPRVLIAGGGFGGLLLGLLLQRLGIPFYLFDGETTTQHLGAALGVGPTILALFEQLGMNNLLASICLPIPTVDFYDAKLRKMGDVSFKAQAKVTGYESLLCSRMSLYELMLSQLAPANILKGKKILSYEENELGITVCCADDSTYCGDILVGADGTHSRIRQILHKNLSNRGLLTKADREHDSPVYVCAAGVAPAQSPEKYPFLKDPYVHFCDVLGSNGMGWSTVNIPDNQICWSLWMQLDMTNVAKVHQEFENPEFVAADTEPIVREFRNRPCPHGGTMGDLIDATPDALKSRAYIGEKMYDTWHHGRTVLLGDACHKMLPWGARAEMNEMQDAVVLANCLLELKDLRMKSIGRSFREYCNQRYPNAKANLLASRAITRLVCGQTLRERVTRYFILNWVPQSYHKRSLAAQNAYRPQVSFLPPAENRGTLVLEPQMSRQWSEQEAAKRVRAVWQTDRVSS